MHPRIANQLAQPSSPAAGHRSLYQRFEPYTFVLPAVVALLLVGLYPTILALWFSLHRLEMLRPGDTAFIGLANYINLVSDVRFFKSLWVQLKFTAVGVSVQLIFGMLVALLLNRPFYGKQVVRSLILLPMLLSPVAVALMWRIFFNGDAGMVNYFLGFLGIPPQPWLGQSHTALWAVVAADVWQWTPFMAMILMAGLESMPSEPFEAAAIDGANHIQVFRFITLPLLIPLIAVACTIRAIDSIRTFDLIYIMTGGGPGTITETTNFLVYLTGFKFYHIGYGSAMAVVLTIIVSFGATKLIQMLRSTQQAENAE